MDINFIWVGKEFWILKFYYDWYKSNVILLFCVFFGYCMKEKIYYKCIKNCKVISIIYRYMILKFGGYVKVWWFVFYS